MFKYSAETILNEKNLTKIIDNFKQREIPRFRKLENYYRSENAIKKRQVGNDKPNNKLAHGFAHYITNMATGYFMGKGVRYEIEDAAYKDKLNGILDKNYTQNTNFEIAKEASKKGVAYEILYLNKDGLLRTKKLFAEDIIPIYSPELDEFLECAIRIWAVLDIEGEATEYADVYTKTEIWSFSRKRDNPFYRLSGTAPHMLGDIPIIVYWNNEEQTGDYEDVISLIDAYDKAQSDTANDFEYFTDAYLVISGAGGGFDTPDAGAGNEDSGSVYGDEYAAKTFKKERILFLDEKGQAQWLVKSINDTAQEKR